MIDIGNIVESGYSGYGKAISPAHLENVVEILRPLKLQSLKFNYFWPSSGLFRVYLESAGSDAEYDKLMELIQIDKEIGIVSQDQFKRLETFIIVNSPRLEHLFQLF